VNHFITLTRAGLDELFKGLGDTRSHKYWKRERVWRRGKPAWRYWYNTAEDRARWQKEHSKSHPGEKVEHFLKEDLETVYEPLRKVLPPTRNWTTGRISQQLVTRPKVTLGILAHESVVRFVDVDPVVHDLGDVQQAIEGTEAYEGAEAEHLADLPLHDLMELWLEHQGLELHLLVDRSVPMYYPARANWLDLGGQDREIVILIDLALEGIVG